jgi:murein L,D-transpeptidase YcbB/YkuD
MGSSGIPVAVEGDVKPILLVAFTSILTAGSAFADDLRLEVDLSERKLVATVGDEILREYDVAVGKPKNPTPQGEFKIRKLIWNPSWKPPAEKWAKGKTAKPPGHPDNPMKVVKIFFREPDYYIHGTDEEESLGRAAPHGCVRMHPEDVTELGKLVMEYGGKPMTEPWYRRIFHRRSTKVIYLSEPVRVAIQE